MSHSYFCTKNGYFCCDLPITVSKVENVNVCVNAHLKQQCWPKCFPNRKISIKINETSNIKNHEYNKKRIRTNQNKKIAHLRNSDGTQTELELKAVE